MNLLYISQKTTKALNHGPVQLYQAGAMVLGVWRYSQLGRVHRDVCRHGLQFPPGAVYHSPLTAALLRAVLVYHTVTRVLGPQLLRTCNNGTVCVSTAPASTTTMYIQQNLPTTRTKYNKITIRSWLIVPSVQKYQLQEEPALRRSVLDGCRTDSRIMWAGVRHGI